MNDSFIKVNPDFFHQAQYEVLLILGQMCVFFERTLEEKVQDKTVSLLPFAGIMPGIQFFNERFVEEKGVEKHLFDGC